jgi:gamma-glutamyltranspeptidase/glutathione hydrolase
VSSRSSTRAGRSTVVGPKGMAATAHPLATLTAIEILKAGGSAVDGAIAANAMLGLVEPVGCGVGGDLFAIVWDPSERALVGLDASGRAPAARTLESIGVDRIPPVGPLSVTVPGAVDGWFMLAERFGRLPMTQLLEPAIHYARAGAPIPSVIAEHWARNLAYFESHDGLDHDAIRALYAPGGTAPAAGTLFRNPALAATYEAIGTGRDAFYEGPIAEAIERTMTRLGGDLRASDLAAHESDWVTPHQASYRGVQVHELGPNTQGIAALQMLRLLEPFDLRAMPEADAIHLSVEAKRLVFEDRARHYADPAHYDAPIERLLSDDYTDLRRTLIDPERARSEVSPGLLEDGDTTYLCVADADGMMVSLIQSNYRGMGSGVVAEGAGFMLQNRGELFATDPAHPNCVAPGKRPFHTIIPAFATRDGEPWLAFGLMGGAMQPQGHVQILQHLLAFDRDLQEAGDASRWRHDGSSEPTGEAADGIGTVHLEPAFDETVQRALAAKGHRVVRSTRGFGGYQAIERAGGVYRGASECRKDGCALGY